MRKQKSTCGVSISGEVFELWSTILGTNEMRQEVTGSSSVGGHGEGWKAGTKL